MIDAVRGLGEYSLKNQGIDVDEKDDLIKILIEDPASNESYTKILKIKIRTTGNQPDFQRIEIDKYNKSKKNNYLYRKGSPNGTDYSPSSRITEPQKTFEGKILRWFQKDNPKANLNKEEIDLIEKIRTILINNRDEILKEIQEIHGQIRREKHNAILTIELVTKDGELLPGEVGAFRKVFLTDVTASYYEKYGSVSKSSNNVCSVCGKEKEVYGFVSTFAFYTVDKPGMVSGGFKQSEAWKNYPVCLKCALLLEQGKQWLEQNASYNFYGFNYLLIPKLLIGSLENVVYDILKTYQREGGQVRVTGSYEALLDDTRDEIFELLSEKSNTFNCIMLIYSASKSEFKILRCIEGVYPSDLKRLFTSKKEVDTSKYIRETMIPIWENRKKKGEKTLNFDFGCFWYFFKDEKQSNYFINIVNDVFKNRQIDKQFLIGRIVQQIRKTHANGFSIEEPVMRGFLNLLYLDKLKLLDKNESENLNKEIREMFPSTESRRIEVAEKIFTSYPTFFKGDAEKAIFIVGALSQLLMNIQYRNRGAKPFRAKLQGLKLDEKIVKSLLPEIQNKLDEYDSNYYRDLETLASEYFIQAQDDWGLSRNEISFYFTLGMNLSKFFTTEREDDKDE